MAQTSAEDNSILVFYIPCRYDYDGESIRGTSNCPNETDDNFQLWPNSVRLVAGENAAVFLNQTRLSCRSPRPNQVCCDYTYTSASYKMYTRIWTNSTKPKTDCFSGSIKIEQSNLETIKPDTTPIITQIYVVLRFETHQALIGTVVGVVLSVALFLFIIGLFTGLYIRDKKRVTDTESLRSKVKQALDLRQRIKLLAPLVFLVWMYTYVCVLAFAKDKMWRDANVGAGYPVVGKPLSYVAIALFGASLFYVVWKFYSGIERVISESEHADTGCCHYSKARHWLGVITICVASCLTAYLACVQLENIGFFLAIGASLLIANRLFVQETPNLEDWTVTCGDKISVKVKRDYKTNYHYELASNGKAQLVMVCSAEYEHEKGEYKWGWWWSWQWSNLVSRFRYQPSYYEKFIPDLTSPLVESQPERSFVVVEDINSFASVVGQLIVQGFFAVLVLSFSTVVLAKAVFA